MPLPAFDPTTDPAPQFARLRESAPVHRTRTPEGLEVWWITRYEDARDALADRRLSHDPEPVHEAMRRAGRPDLILPEDPHTGSPLKDMLTSDPPEHTRLRGVLRKAFAPPRVEALRPRVGVRADELIDVFAPAGEANLMRELTVPLAQSMVLALVGLPAEASSWTREELLPVVARTRPDVDLDLPIDEQPSVLHALIAACDGEQRLSDQEVVQTLDLLIGAGSGGGRALAGVFCALLAHPDQIELLRERPELLEPAVEELLRWAGGDAQTRGRVALEDVEIGGTTIPRGSLVQIAIDAADRDPRRFPRPDELLIERGENRHLAFGRGTHFCLGAPLVRVLAQVAIPALLERLPDVELACPPEELPWRSDSVDGELLLITALTRSLSALPVRFTPRTTAKAAC